jgi:hypothetical protein
MTPQYETSRDGYASIVTLFNPKHYLVFSRSTRKKFERNAPFVLFGIVVMFCSRQQALMAAHLRLVIDPETI